MRRLAVCLILVLPCSAALAQGKVQLEFPEGGRRVVWVGQSLPDEIPADAETVSGKSFSVNAPDEKEGRSFFVWDQEANRIAQKPLDKIAGGKWSIQSSDFTLLGKVSVRVEREGRPVLAASVKFDAKRTPRTRFVTANARTAEFFAVKPGPVVIEATYDSEGKTKTHAESHTVSLDKGSAPVFVLSLPDPVETVGAPVAPTTSTSSPGSAAGTVLGNILTYVLSLAVGIGILYGVFRLLQNKKAEQIINENLQKLGVDVRDPSTDQDEPMPAPKQPEPPQKIILDAAIPEPAGLGPAVGIVGGPRRLVGEAGASFDLEEGLHVIGREDGLPITVRDSSVSRRHAQIVRNGEEVTVVDLGSTNGTYVNGVKIDAERALRPGDTLQVGAVRFTVEG